MTQASESIFYYELHRKQLLNLVKKHYDLKLNDLLFLKHLLACNSTCIPLYQVKRNLTFSLMEVHKSLTTLTDQQIIGKKRSSEDERKVFITLNENQIEKIKYLLKEFEALQKNVLPEMN
ncbi:regulator [Staphylococcus piscifermentans]|nr:regulator [Staphylococcus piscifermentans]RTX86603.1 regulator [Staphylococcus piscifermentans]